MSKRNVQKKTIDFLGKAKYFVALSLVIVSLGMVAALLEPVGKRLDPGFTAPVGINWGIDFSPGTILLLNFEKEPSITQINATLADFSKQTGVKYRQAQVVEAQGVSAEKGSHQVSIRMGFMDTRQDANLQAMLKKVGDFTVLQKNSVGPVVGASLIKRALETVLFACIFIFVFVAWKYEPALSLAALGALAHDILIMISGFAIFGFEINSPFVAAMGVVIGYSVNDTIVIFDRIRENVRVMRRATAEEVFNTSLSQVLGRSLTTSATVILVLLTLGLFGGDSLRGMSFALLIGILAGAYSSLFIAPMLAMRFSQNKRLAGKISQQLSYTHKSGIATASATETSAQQQQEGEASSTAQGGVDTSGPQPSSGTRRQRRR